MDSRTETNLCQCQRRCLWILVLGATIIVAVPVYIATLDLPTPVKLPLIFLVMAAGYVVSGYKFRKCVDAAHEVISKNRYESTERVLSGEASSR